MTHTVHTPAADTLPTKLAATTPVWHVLGAGAMGCLWAGALARQHSEHSIRLLIKDAQLTDYAGFITVERNNVTERVYLGADISAGTQAADISKLLLTTKAQHTAAALDAVRHRLRPGACIVLLQNGVQAQLQARDTLQAYPLFSLSTSHGAWQPHPFHVIHAGFGQAWLGPLNETALPQLDKLAAQLPQAQMAVQADIHILQRIWRKFAINCVINGLTVYYNCKNGELWSDPQRRQHVLQLAQETGAIMAQVPETGPLNDLPEAVAQVLQQTAANVSSTLQDVRRARPTEIDELNGYLIHWAERLQLPCPLNRQVLQAVHQASANQPGQAHPENPDRKNPDRKNPARKKE